MTLTSETPTLGCLGGTPVWFLASEKYSGNGRHAVEEKNKQFILLLKITKLGQINSSRLFTSGKFKKKKGLYLV